MSTRLKRAPKSVPQVRRFPSGPFVGMRDSIDPTAGEQGLAKMLRNVYPVDPQFGGAVLHRPGYYSIDGDHTAFSYGPAQCFHQFKKLDGTSRTLAIVYSAGIRYEAGDWLPAGGTILASGSTSGPYYAVTFSDTVVWSDGYGSPFLWDGVNAVTSLSSAIPGAFYGPPVVHYGKLFGIKANERSTMIWSEENDPATGYEAGGYNNAWTLLQTDTSPLERLLATNEGLIVFRRRSITAISGEVNENFASTGTREAISSEIGTASPGSVFFGGDDGELIFWADADGRPHYMPNGGTPQPIWEDARVEIARFDPARFNAIQGYWDSRLGHAVFCYALKGETSKLSTMLRYHVKGGVPRLACVWDGYNISRIGVVEIDGAPAVLHSESTLDGPVYPVHRHQAPDPVRTPLADDEQIADDYTATVDTNLQMDVNTPGNADGYAEAFTAARAGKLIRLKVWLTGDTAVVGTIVAKLYSFTGTYATNALPSSLLATSTAVNLNTLPATGSGNYVEFEFPTGQNYALTAGGEYMWAVEVVSSTENILLGAVLSGSGVHTGNVAQLVDGAWSDHGTAALRVPFAVTLGESVARKVELHPQPYSELGEWHFDRLDVQVRAAREVTLLYAQTTTPHALSSAALVGFEAGSSLWDSATWDSSTWGYGESARHGSLGIDAWGSGCGVILTQSGYGLPFSLLSVALTGRPVGQDARGR